LQPPPGSGAAAGDRRPPIGVLTGAALLLAGALGGAAAYIETTYLDHNPYFFDAVVYSYDNVRLYTRLAKESRLSLTWEEWRGNYRHPLRTVPLLLFAPRLLAHRAGHLATALPALALFLLVLGWTVYRRTQHLGYTLGCMTLFCAIPGMFSPTSGLGAYLLDLPAAFLVGTAALCLLNSRVAQDARWLVAFGIAVSAAALSRYVAGGYALFTCGPVLAAYCVATWRRERSFVRSVLAPAAVVGAVVGATAGYFVIVHMRANLSFYSTFGYVLGRSLSESSAATVGGLTRFLSKPLIVFLIALAALNIWLFGRGNRAAPSTAPAEWQEGWPVLLWLGSSHLLLLVLVLRSGAHPQAVLYAVPVLFFAAVSPLRWSGGDRRAVAAKGLAITLAVAAAGGAAWQGNRQARAAWHDNPDKALDISLARELRRQGDRIVWNAFFDEYAWIPTMEAFYGFGTLALPAGQEQFFTVHESAWRGYYPGMTPEEIGHRVYERTCRWVDVAVVFADALAAEKRLSDPYSRAVARIVSESIQRDERWRPIFRLETRYGTLAGYRNRAMKISGEAYDLRLRGTGLP
jgi:hypothetical protein